MAKDQIRITFNIGGSKQLDGAEQTGYCGTVLQTIYKRLKLSIYVQQWMYTGLSSRSFRKQLRANKDIVLSITDLVKQHYKSNFSLV